MQRPVPKMRDRWRSFGRMSRLLRSFQRRICQIR
ncbi:unnamed protein product [Soboliphyme baturini]|uniref:Uncharacterized protein n=1 Tax=Soboliphyme baturini TaxID=241478 RepID=A0A183IPF5_9BILA|nr:unnamed protein product [Soboliphyme baturini]